MEDSKNPAELEEYIDKPPMEIENQTAEIISENPSEFGSLEEFVADFPISVSENRLISNGFVFASINKFSVQLKCFSRTLNDGKNYKKKKMSTKHQMI